VVVLSANQPFAIVRDLTLPSFSTVSKPFPGESTLEKAVEDEVAPETLAK